MCITFCCVIPVTTIPSCAFARSLQTMSTVKTYFPLGRKLFVNVKKRGKSVKIHLGEYDVQCDGKMEPKRSVEMNLRQFEQLLRVKESVRDHCLNLTRALPSGDEAGQELTQQPHCSLRGDDSFPSVPAFYTPVVHSEL